MRTLNIVQASHKAAEIVQRNPDMLKLYELAVRRFGEGELHAAVLDLMSDVVMSETRRNDVLESNESALSFCCGVWIQFLLVEIAGIKQDQLRELAQKVFQHSTPQRTLH
jgi:hypothetical protein